MSRDRAALRPIQPAVGTPPQTVSYRMRVLQPEAGEMHDGIAVGNIVAIGVRIEEEVRRVQHPNAATPPPPGRDEAQPLGGWCMFVEHTHAIRTFENRL